MPPSQSRVRIDRETLADLEGVSEERLGMALRRQVGIPDVLERIRDA